MQALAPMLAAYRALDVDVGQQALFIAARRAFGNDYVMFVVMLALAHSVPYYGWNIFYTIVARLLPKETEKYRWLQNRRADPALVRRAVLYVSVYHILAPIAPMFLYDAAIANHPTMFTDRVPGILTCALQVPLAYLITDFFFYWGHRMLHTPFFYKRVHKQHHEFNVTVGWACEYAHPFEFIIGNVIPVIAGPVLLKYHFFVFVLWMSIAISGTTWGHSGFGPPLALSDGSHDFHHSNNTCNFGSMKHLDRIFGTDAAWRKHVAKLEADKLKRAKSQ